MMYQGQALRKSKHSVVIDCARESVAMVMDQFKRAAVAIAAIKRVIDGDIIIKEK